MTLDASDTTAAMPGFKLAVLLPAFNEEGAIRQTIVDFQEQMPGARIIVIDNGSSDNTVAIAKSISRPGHDMVLHEPTPGKGSAVKRGLASVEAHIYVIADADYTYPAHELKAMVALMLEERLDQVVGDRIAGGAYASTEARFGHQVGNRVISKAVSVLLAADFSDVLSGARVLSRPFADSLDVRSSGFELETELNWLSSYLRAGFAEVPISYRDRPVGSASKLSSVIDGLKILSFALRSAVTLAPIRTMSFVYTPCIFLGLGSVIQPLSMLESTNDSVFARVSWLAGILGVGLFCVSLTLRAVIGGSRRREIALLQTRKRRWNAELDDCLL